MEAIEQKEAEARREQARIKAEQEMARKVREIERDPDLFIVEGDTDGGYLKLVVNIRTKEIVETFEWEPPEDYYEMGWEPDYDYDYGSRDY